MRFYLLFLVLLCAVPSALAQSGWSYGVGAGLNASKLFLEKDSIDYIETYNPRVGLNLKQQVAYQWHPAFKIGLEPGISITNTKDNAGFKTSAVYVNLGLKLWYTPLKRFSVNAGAAYQYLLGIKLSKGNNSATITGLANHRHFITPGLGLGYDIGSGFSCELEALYAITDLLNGGAEDGNGNIIGPLKAYNHSLNFTLWYTLAAPQKSPKQKSP